MNILTILTWLRSHKNIVSKAFLGLLTAFLLGYGIVVHNQNKTLSNRLEIANNNIEAYLGVINNSQLANNVLKLDMSLLQNTNDKLIQQIDSMRKELKIKPKTIHTVATQTQTIYVKENKGVGGGDIIKTITKDTVYNDSIQYNDLTKVHYTIGKDTVSIALDIKNLLFLYVYKHKLYKNKKSFIKRLFTLDFKKVYTYRYDIKNTNDLIKTSNVRVIENIDK